MEPFKVTPVKADSQILEIGVICIDGQKYPEEAWIDVTGKLVEL